MVRRLFKALRVPAVAPPDEPPPIGAAHAGPVPARSTPSLASDTLVCLLDPDGTELRPSARYAMAAALLLELVHERRLDVAGTGKDTRVTVRDAVPIGNEELDEVLQHLRPFGPQTKLPRKMPLFTDVQGLTESLIAQGLLAEESHKTLGFIPRRRVVPTAAAGREQLLAGVRGALVGESVPDERTALLITAIDAGTPLKLFVPRGRAREADRRAAEIRERLSQEDRAVLSAILAHREKNSGDYYSGV